MRILGARIGLAAAAFALMAGMLFATSASASGSKAAGRHGCGELVTYTTSPLARPGSIVPCRELREGQSVTIRGVDFPPNTTMACLEFELPGNTLDPSEPLDIAIPPATHIDLPDFSTDKTVVSDASGNVICHQTVVFYDNNSPLPGSPADGTPGPKGKCPPAPSEAANGDICAFSITVPVSGQDTHMFGPFTTRPPCQGGSASPAGPGPCEAGDQQQALRGRLWGAI